MTIKEIARFAKVKGLDIVATGDFTHPKWFNEIKESLATKQNAGVYKVVNDPDSSVHFMLTAEVCTIFDFSKSVKKIHHVILAPSIEVADQINHALKKYGDLSVDGRPILKITAPQLVEEVMQISIENMVFPAHVWTPWFSAFGAFSGFDRIEDCYQDMTKHIHALETGLSSDPPMNWRLSNLDRFTLVSNSDCHSFWPWRLGREANVFELREISYTVLMAAIRNKDPERFKFTVETEPAYGKYHWTGHRNCNVSFSPKEAQKFGSICPICRRKLTKGVEQRIEELADRPYGFKPDNVPGFMRLLPLSEIIATVLDSSSPATQAVWQIYNLLVTKFGNEYNVLINASQEELRKIVDIAIADAIIKVRTGRVTVVPGYDGVYGKLNLEEPKVSELHNRRVQQRNLADFM